MYKGRFQREWNTLNSFPMDGSLSVRSDVCPSFLMLHLRCTFPFSHRPVIVSNQQLGNRNYSVSGSSGVPIPTPLIFSSLIPVRTRTTCLTTPFNTQHSQLCSHDSLFLQIFSHANPTSITVLLTLT